MKVETLTLSGAVDLHVHWREPGNNKSETIESGSRAALRGGFVLACDMPNNPGNPTWTYQLAKEKQRRGAYTSHIPFAIYAGSQPESDNVNELAAMSEVCIGYKGYATKTTGNENEHQAEDFRPALTEWHRLAPEKPFMLHAGQGNLQDFIDLVAKELGHHLHVCNVNSPADVKLVARAKAAKLPITCGVCPHHLLMTSHDSFTQGNFAKMQPPLADQVDAEQLFYLLNSGDIDIMETDHAPHSKEAKWRAEHEGGECFGVPGSELALPLLFYQMKKGRISPKRIEKITSIKPAQIIGVKISAYTRVTWSMDEYRVEDEAEQVVSGAGWTPYLGMLAVGKVQRSQVQGKYLIDRGVEVGRKAQILTSRGAII